MILNTFKTILEYNMSSLKILHTCQNVPTILPFSTIHFTLSFIKLSFFYLPRLKLSTYVWNNASQCNRIYLWLIRLFYHFTAIQMLSFYVHFIPLTILVKLIFRYYKLRLSNKPHKLHSFISLEFVNNYCR